MRVSPVNSYGYTVPNLKRTVNCNQSVETTGSVAFGGFTRALTDGTLGALVGFAFGGPVGAFVGASLGAGVGANIKEPPKQKDVFGNFEESFPYAADEALGVIHFD